MWGGFAVDHLDDVEAELRAHRRADLAGLQLEGGVGELRHDAFPGEQTDVPLVLLGGGVAGQLHGEVFEILALLEAVDDLVGPLLGGEGFLGRSVPAHGDQDVAGADLLRLVELVGRTVVIELLDLLRGDGDLVLDLFVRPLLAGEFAVDALP